MNKSWTDYAWDDYLYWQTQDRKTLKKINKLIRDIERDPYKGIGDPEPLKGNRQGYWSRRIDYYNRIVYRVEKDQLIFVQCCGHYDD
ncbi:MAG: Txe/YoeB family addiction module toxin [Oscillospiraceae bacterium]|nr:Txe/YoeB family addiction module toxin [Oscillospiraceae bacterium]